MVPTNRNSRGVRAVFLALTAGFGLLCGCGAPGPRALVKGERLIQEGRYSEAVEKLRAATELMPKDAVAWNFLGLAYHGNRQYDDALRAYRTALSLDHKLNAVRFNLGCLLLDQNQLAPAIEELTAFTIANSTAPDGWLKLGAARLRARHLDEAERCFNLALEQQPKNAEALNGLGLVAQQRRRTQDAALLFQKALAQDPDYGPALLNLAVLNQQSLNDKAKALQLYRQYLALKPRPADAAGVEQIVRALDPGSVPAVVAPTQVASVTPPAVRSNEPAPARSITPPVTAPETNAGVIASLRPVVRTNIAVAATPAVGSSTATVTPPATIVRAKPPVVTPVAKPPPPVATTVTPPPVKPVVATPVPALNTNPLPDLQVTQVAGDLVIRPAQEMTREPAPTLTPAAPGEPRVTTSGANYSNLALGSPTEAPAREKRSFLAKLNPFKSKPKPAKSASTPVAGTVTGMVYTARETGPARATPTPVRTFERYGFLSPAKPGTGNRVAADRSLQRGYAAHQAGKYSLAISEYQQAVKADPGCFEAYYNLGLAAQENRDFKRALQAYEYALAVQPDSADARYNFGLALKQGDYPMDAADQLSPLLKQTPNDVRVHLLLGNIYSQLLNQASFAREHYQRVLELEPRHPEAARIRYWLAANQ